MPSSDALGAYGFRIAGPSGSESWLVRAPANWPPLEVEVRPGREDFRGAFIDDERADLELIDGIVAHLQRSPTRVTFVSPGPLSPQALVHPFLSGAVSVLGYWLGRESFHAGAFVSDGKAWCVIAEREGGKSTTLAALAQEGVAVLADDLVALDGNMVLAGPRSVDLRAEPTTLIQAEPLGIVGARLRWRVTLGPVPAEVPLGGWIFLGWSDEISLRRLSGGERLERLAASRSLRLLPRDPVGLLRLSALPGFEVLRPHDSDDLRATVDLMHEAVSAK